MPTPITDPFVGIAMICTADVNRARKHPGKQHGTLRPYLGIAVTFDHAIDSNPAHDVYIILDADGNQSRVFGAAVAMNTLAMEAGGALADLKATNPAKYQTAVDFILRAGLTAP